MKPQAVAIVAGLGVAALLGLWVWKKGGIAPAAQAVGGAAVDAVGGVASGVVGGVSEAVGLPTPAQTTTAAEVARWVIDHPAGGYFAASKWAGAVAFGQALLMDAGSGKPPAAGSQLAGLFPVLPQADYDEADRLARRYPAPASGGATDYSAGGWDFGGSFGWGSP
jgi:hypothetical protein